MKSYSLPIQLIFPNTQHLLVKNTLKSYLVDYVITWKNIIIPVEVKGGPTGRLKSLHQFMKEKKSRLGICISEAPLTYDNDHKILSLPFYLLSKLPDILEEILL